MDNIWGWILGVVFAVIVGLVIAHKTCDWCGHWKHKHSMKRSHLFRCTIGDCMCFKGVKW